MNLEILIPAPLCLAVFYLKVLWFGGQLGTCSLFLPTYTLQRSYSQAVHTSSIDWEMRARTWQKAGGRLTLCASLWDFLGDK